MKTTKQNNILISEFMQHKPTIEVCVNDKIIVLPNPIRKYNSNWDDLMKVVEKIETLKYFNKEIQFKITKYAVCLQTLTDDCGTVIDKCIFSKWATYGGTDKIMAVYCTCIEYIKFYNKQLKTIKHKI